MPRSGRSELSFLMALDCECEDCGRIRRLQKRALRELERRGHTSVRQVWSKMYCQACSERKGKGRNVRVTPRWFPGHTPQN